MREERKENAEQEIKVISSRSSRLRDDQRSFEYGTIKLGE